jgi:enterochelin esterase-like enzyme
MPETIPSCLAALLLTVVSQQVVTRPVSPLLVRLTAELDAGNRGALDTFWSQLAGKMPLIEEIPGDSRNRWLTWVWRGHPDTQSVDLLGEVPTTNMSRWGTRRLRDTDVWFKTETVPADSRFGYMIRENGGPFQLDPLNSRSFAGRSIAELPDAPHQDWIIEAAAVPKGRLIKANIRSRVLHEDRAIGVYVPGSFRQGVSHFGLIVLLDGEAYGNGPNSLIPTPTILDNLIARKKIPPMVTILVNSQMTRDRDLLCSVDFANFLSHELAPWARENYGVASAAKRTVIAGSSYGGLAAAFTALRSPEVFGNVLSQSGTFSYYPGWQPNATDYATNTGWLTRQFAISPKQPTRFYLEVGIFEGGPIYSLLRENRNLRDVLEARGYALSYREFSGGHDYLTWRNSLGDGLIALVGNMK